MQDNMQPHEALELIRQLRSADWRLTHVPTNSTWSGEQLRVAVDAVGKIPAELVAK